MNRALIAIMCTLGALGCERRQQFPVMEFAVIDSLLGPVVRDTVAGVRFRVPRGAVRVDSLGVDEAPMSWVAELQQGGTVAHWWAAPHDTSGLMLAGLEVYPDSQQQRLIDTPELFFRSTQTLTTTYRSGRLVWVQHSLQDSLWSGFHLMAMEGGTRRFRVLLYCKRHSYGQIARRWESVIGSFLPGGGVQLR